MPTVFQPSTDPAATAAAIVAELRGQRNERNIEGQRRFGITPTKCELLGIPAPVLRALARRHRRDHALSAALWAYPIHEARAVAALGDDPKQVTRRQLERWACDFDSWALTDCCCTQLFNHTPFAVAKAQAWSRRPAEFVKRAGFVLMAGLAVHAKALPDDVFVDFLPVIARESDDPRNFVKKAVNWALRQIGKRSPALRRAAVAEAKRILARDTPSSRWIACDALRELRRRR